MGVPIYTCGIKLLNFEIRDSFRAFPQKTFLGRRSAPENLCLVRDHHVRRHHGQVLVHVLGVRVRWRGDAETEQPVAEPERGPQERHGDAARRRPKPDETAETLAHRPQLLFGVRFQVPAPQAPRAKPAHAEVRGAGSGVRPVPGPTVAAAGIARIASRRCDRLRPINAVRRRRRLCPVLVVSVSRRCRRACHFPCPCCSVAAVSGSEIAVSTRFYNMI